MRILVGRPLLALAIGVSAAGCGSSTSAPPPASEPPTPMASPAPVDAAPRQVPAPEPPLVSAARRHDLSADARRGGHTIERHVGRTDEQLRERLRREPGISAASTYPDLVTAEQVVARAFDQSAREVEQWKSRRDRRPNLVIERTEPQPIGRSLRRGQQTPSSCDRAVVVIRWDDRQRSSYVLTSYPECRR